MAEPGSPIRNLEPDDILLRALRSRGELDYLPFAFMLRDNERDSGLSVKFDCTHEECRAEFKKSYGVASLFVRGVTELDLKVIPDEPKHANIIGIPHKEDDPIVAERLASLLAGRATLVSTGLVKNEPQP
jgi:hypothetical protein